MPEGAAGILEKFHIDNLAIPLSLFFTNSCRLSSVTVLSPAPVRLAISPNRFHEHRNTGASSAIDSLHHLAMNPCWQLRDVYILSSAMRRWIRPSEHATRRNAMPLRIDCHLPTSPAPRRHADRQRLDQWCGNAIATHVICRLGSSPPRASRHWSPPCNHRPLFRLSRP